MLCIHSVANIINYPLDMCYMLVYTHLCVYHQWICWICCHFLEQTSVGGTAYEFIIAKYGDICLNQIACLHQFINPFLISAVNVLCKFTLYCCV